MITSSQTFNLASLYLTISAVGVITLVSHPILTYRAFVQIDVAEREKRLAPRCTKPTDPNKAEGNNKCTSTENLPISASDSKAVEERPVAEESLVPADESQSDPPNRLRAQPLPTVSGFIELKSPHREKANVSTPSENLSENSTVLRTPTAEKFTASEDYVDHKTSAPLGQDEEASTARASIGLAHTNTPFNTVTISLHESHPHVAAEDNHIDPKGTDNSSYLDDGCSGFTFQTITASDTPASEDAEAFQEVDASVVIYGAEHNGSSAKSELSLSALEQAGKITPGSEPSLIAVEEAAGSPASVAAFRSVSDDEVTADSEAAIFISKLDFTTKSEIRISQDELPATINSSTGEHPESTITIPTFKQRTLQSTSPYLKLPKSKNSKTGARTLTRKGCAKPTLKKCHEPTRKKHKTQASADQELDWTVEELEVPSSSVFVGAASLPTFVGNPLALANLESATTLSTVISSDLKWESGSSSAESHEAASTPAPVSVLKTVLDAEAAPISEAPSLPLALNALAATLVVELASQSEPFDAVVERPTVDASREAFTSEIQPLSSAAALPTYKAEPSLELTPSRPRDFTSPSSLNPPVILGLGSSVMAFPIGDLQVLDGGRKSTFGKAKRGDGETSLIVENTRKQRLKNIKNHYLTKRPPPSSSIDFKRKSRFDSLFFPSPLAPVETLPDKFDAVPSSPFSSTHEEWSSSSQCSTPTMPSSLSSSPSTLLTQTGFVEADTSMFEPASAVSTDVDASMTSQETAVAHTATTETEMEEDGVEAMPSFSPHDEAASQESEVEMGASTKLAPSQTLTSRYVVPNAELNTCPLSSSIAVDIDFYPTSGPSTSTGGEPDVFCMVEDDFFRYYNPATNSFDYPSPSPIVSNPDPAQPVATEGFWDIQSEPVPQPFAAKLSAPLLNIAPNSLGSFNTPNPIASLTANTSSPLIMASQPAIPGHPTILHPSSADTRPLDFGSQAVNLSQQTVSNYDLSEVSAVDLAFMNAVFGDLEEGNTSYGTPAYQPHPNLLRNRYNSGFEEESDDEDDFGIVLQEGSDDEDSFGYSNSLSLLPPLPSPPTTTFDHHAAIGGGPSPGVIIDWDEVTNHLEKQEAEAVSVFPPLPEVRSTSTTKRRRRVRWRSCCERFCR